MYSRKVIAIVIVCSTIFSGTCVSPVKGLGTTYLVQGVFQLPTPVGSCAWNVILTTGREYGIALGLFTPGSARFILAVKDPWDQNYTFVDLDFTHGADSGDLYRTTFVAPLSGTYTLNLTSRGGSAEAINAYFAIADAGAISNTHTSSFGTGTALADAHACNTSHAIWAYFVPLASNTTYYIDVSRGDPSCTSVPITVKAWIQALDGPEVAVLFDTTLEWDAPAYDETQVLLWSSEWFGVPSTAKYNLVIQASGLMTLDPVVVVVTVNRDHAYGETTPAANSSSSTPSTSVGFTIGPENLVLSAGIGIAVLGIAGIAFAGKRRRGGITAGAGELQRPGIAEEA